MPSTLRRPNRQKLAASGKLQLEAPHQAHRLPLLAETVLFATIPVHAEQRRSETIAIKGALRFQIVTTQQELERRFGAQMTARNILMWA